VPARIVARRSRRGTGARRRSTWATHQSTEVFAAANDLHTVDLLDAYKAAGGPVVGITVARTLLHLVTTAGTPASGRAYNVGLIRGQNTDVGTNIAGAPNPASNFFEDWAWLEQLDYCVQAGAGPNMSEGGSNVINRDTRSKRKLPELQMNWNLAISSAAAQSLAVYARTLLLLP
jgi:hypothetical protein